eukprot:gene16024-22162_t
MALTEDPTIKMLRSGFGKQVESDNSTDPAYGFGTSHRDAYQKLYLSKEQTLAMSGNNSQGSVYKYQSAIGTQPESKYSTSSSIGFGSSSRSIKYGKNGVPGPGTYNKGGAIGVMPESQRATSPRALFGNSTRDGEAKVWLDEELMKTTMGRDTPGPNSYKQPGCVGNQTESKYATLPTWKQGTAERFADKDTRRDFPGAGTYGVGTPAVGKQPNSTKRTQQNAKIGTSTRDGASKVFVSKEHEKSQHGRNTPGPTTCPVVHSFGTQTLSAKKTNPSFGFGTAKRDVGNRNDSPGPGSYWA